MDQPTNRPQPRTETSGSRQRPPERISGPVLAFDLSTEAAQLRREDSWGQNDRNARTLLREPGVRVTLIALKAGARLEQHTAPGALTIQALSGRLRLTVAGEVKDLPANHLLALEPDLPHDVEAVEESTFLLTLAAPAHREGLSDAG